MKTIVILPVLFFSLSSFAGRCQVVAASGQEFLEKLVSDSFRTSYVGEIRRQTQGSQSYITYKAGQPVYSQDYRVNTVYVGKALFRVPKEALVSRIHLPNYTPPKRSQLDEYKGKIVEYVKQDQGFGMIRVSKVGSSKKYDLASVTGAVQVTAGDLSVFVMENTSQYVVIKELRVPDEIPQKENVFIQDLDITPTVQNVVPVMMAYGRFLILGGNELGILSPRLGVYGRIPMSDDYGRNPVVALKDIGDGKISVIRKITDPEPQIGNPPEFYQKGFYFAEYVIDLKALQVPIQRY